MMAPLRPTNQPTPPSSPTSLGWHLLGTTAQLLRHVNLHGLELRSPTSPGWSSKCRGLTNAKLNKSRIEVWLIWLQVGFVAQQQACSLKKVENYHSTMKKKTFQPASGMRCSFQLNEVNSRYHINLQCHNLLTAQIWQTQSLDKPTGVVLPAGASAGPSEDRDRPGAN